MRIHILIWSLFLSILCPLSDGSPVLRRTLDINLGETWDVADNPNSETTTQKNQVSDAPIDNLGTPGQQYPYRKIDGTARPITGYSAGPGKTPVISPIPVDFLTPLQQQLKNYYNAWSLLSGSPAINWDKPASESILEIANAFRLGLPNYWESVPFSRTSATQQIHENFKDGLMRIDDGSFVITDPNTPLSDQMKHPNSVRPEVTPEMCQARKAAGIIESSSTSTGRACAKFLAPNGAPNQTPNGVSTGESTGSSNETPNGQ